MGFFYCLVHLLLLVSKTQQQPTIWTNTVLLFISIHQIMNLWTAKLYILSWIDICASRKWSLFVGFAPSVKFPKKQFCPVLICCENAQIPVTSMRRKVNKSAPAAFRFYTPFDFCFQFILFVLPEMDSTSGPHNSLIKQTHSHTMGAAIAQWIDLCLSSVPPLVMVPSTPTTLITIYILIVSCGKVDN